MLFKRFKVVDFKASDTSPGEYEAIVSVFNNVDDGGDRVLPGAFTDTIKANPNPPVVWSHMWGIPPIGETLEWSQNDVGLLVRARLFVAEGEDHPYARMCYTGMKTGALREFSFAYDIIDGGYVTEDGVEVFDLANLDVFEHGPCLVGMNRETQLLQVAAAAPELANPRDRFRLSGGKATTPFADLAVCADRTRAFQRDDAEPRVRKWASSDGSGDKDTIDWAKYRQAFFWVDDTSAEHFQAYTLMFGDVVDGTLDAVASGVYAAAGVVQGARGGVAIPDGEREGVRHHIERYYAKLRVAFDDDTLVAPWLKTASGDTTATLADVNALLAKTRHAEEGN